MRERLGARGIIGQMRLRPQAIAERGRKRGADGGRMNTRYSQSELEALLADVESDLVGRKESLRGDAPRTIRQAVCAFANDLPDHRRPGLVFVGVDDSGRPTGLEITDELLRQLADMRSDGNIVPPPTLTVGKELLQGKAVAVVAVQPADSPPVRHRGTAWVRVGPRRAIASAQDERILNEKRRHRDPHFDAQPVRGAELGDLLLGRFNDEYLPAAIDPELLAANDRTNEERLAAAKMIRSTADPTPTVAGVLVLGRRPLDHLPGAYVQFLRVGGTEWGGEVLDEARCDGPIADQIRRLDDKLIAHNRVAVDFTSGPVEIRRPTYPLPALQQLTRNAVMHRAYEGTNAPVRVCWFDDRVEIVSPGGPYGIVTVETFGQPGAVDYRNPTLAEAMRVLDLVQRYGFGIAAARRALRDNGQPEPEFDVRPETVRCTVRQGS